MDWVFKVRCCITYIALKDLCDLSMDEVQQNAAHWPTRQATKTKHTNKQNKTTTKRNKDGCQWCGRSSKCTFPFYLTLFKFVSILTVFRDLAEMSSENVHRFVLSFEKIPKKKVSVCCDQKRIRRKKSIKPLSGFSSKKREAHDLSAHTTGLASSKFRPYVSRKLPRRHFARVLLATLWPHCGCWTGKSGSGCLPPMRTFFA